MTRAALITELNRLHEIMDGAIDGVVDAAILTQEAVYQAMLKMVNRFELQDGAFVVNQDYTARLARFTNKVNEILGDIYQPALSEYLSTYRTIEETNIALQKSYNQLEIETDLLSPARKALYNQAKYYLSPGQGLADAYVQPAKYLVMQHVTTGISLKDSQKILKRWNEGETVTNVRQTVNLQRYALQVSRDCLYQANGAINEVIADRYGLTAFVYTGNVIEDSRPMCRHLVNLDRTIEISEMAALIKKYPQGLYPNTTKDNWILVRGGYGCRHSCFSVRE